MSLDPLATYEKYSAAWNAEDANEGVELLAESWADDGAIFDPDNPEGIKGRPALVDYIMKTQAEMAGLDIQDTSEPQVLGARLRTKWVAKQDGAIMFTGTDFIEFAPDGRISQVTMFYDSSPE